MDADTTALGPGASCGILPGAERAARVAAERSAQAEGNRRLDPQTVAAIADAGFMRHFVPARMGGTAGRFLDYVRALSTVAEGDPSAAWCAGVFSSLGRMASFLPAEAQRAVWADKPDTVIVGALMPRGTAERTAGGWRLTGKWPFISGIHFADWALVCSAVENDSGSREVRYLAIPRSEFSIEDTWFNMGMRATGSDTLVLTDVIIPANYSFPREDLLAGRSPDSSAPCHQVPLKAVTGLSFAAPVLGAAKGALHAWSAAAAPKWRAADPQDLVYGASRASAEFTLARTSGELDAAQLLLERAAATADRGILTALDVSCAQRDHVVAVDLAIEAANAVFRLAGTNAQDASHRLQRFWRDANSGAGHTVLQFEPAARGYAEQVFAAMASAVMAKPA